MIRALSHLFTLAIPAILILAGFEADRIAARSDAEWRAYLEQLPENAPPCARDRAGRDCVCADFTRRADAEAYAELAARKTGRMFGLDFDGDGAVCEHLP